MARFLVQVVINAIALYVAASVVTGAEITSDLINVLIVALIFGGLNALVRPVLSIITCPAYILTLGLFTFVMNVIILNILEWLSTIILGSAAITFDGFWPALWTGILVSIVSFILNLVLGENRNN